MRSVGGCALLWIAGFLLLSLLREIGATNGATKGALSQHIQNGRIFASYQGGEEQPMSIDIDSVPCMTHEDCRDALPGIDTALGTGSPIPKEPFCKYNSSWNSSGYCSCDPDYCVSYSMRYGKDMPFYYCGPCARIGSQCSNGTCAHEMAECREEYCQCIRSGSFYEFYYCEIPYVLYETSLQICIIITILIVSSFIVSSLCAATGLDRCWQSRRSSGSTSETSDGDAPPAYDEVMDNLPTYQDAVQMAQEVEGRCRNERNVVATDSPRTNAHRSEFRREIEEVTENNDALSTSTSIPHSSDDEVSSDVSSGSHDYNESLSSQRDHQPIEWPLRRPLNIQTIC
ncbi:uncharacterized protein LOC135198486 isoform X2 [Macrobrachium nipponense]|uniref:uncharacterized protein LOC135198486 isoform X2 n=1 Tax=Macrobrachium nipponense TaxID=159736 RepID=UPI0030C8390C